MCCYFEINQTLKKPWIHFHFIRFLSHCVFRHIIRSCNIGTKCEFRIIIKAAFVSGLLNQQTCLCSTPALQLKSVTFSRTLACKLNAADIPVISVWDISCWAWYNTEKYISSVKAEQRSMLESVMGGYQRKQWQWKPPSKCAKVLIHNTSSRCLHYSIIGDLGSLWLKCQPYEGKTLLWPPWIWINEIFRLWFSFPSAPRATWLS